MVLAGAIIWFALWVSSSFGDERGTRSRFVGMLILLPFAAFFLLVTGVCMFAVVGA